MRFCEIMKTRLVTWTIGGVMLVAPGIAATTIAPKIEAGMASGDREIANQAIAACVAKGVSVLPQLREWSAADDPRLRVRARSAIGQLTGQWGSQTDLIWGRSFDEAKSKGKPILLLQLFGNLDEEFC